jgi:hypothetical protein
MAWGEVLKAVPEVSKGLETEPKVISRPESVPELNKEH